MKKISLFLVSLFVFYACFDDSNNQLGTTTNVQILPIETFQVPDSLTFGILDTIKITYILPTSCYAFNSLYGEQEGDAQLIAVAAVVADQDDCADIAKQETFEFGVMANKTEDYIFKFWKGRDAGNNENIYQEVTIPVKTN